MRGFFGGLPSSSESAVRSMGGFFFCCVCVTLTGGCDGRGDGARGGGAGRGDGARGTGAGATGRGDGARGTGAAGRDA